MNIKQAIPFFWVSDIDRSTQYYTDGLGFKMTNQWINNGKLEWCWLQIDDAAIMLQQFKKESDYAKGKLGLGVTIYFVCDDAIAFYKQVIKQGIQARKPFVGNGMWVTSLLDPDGYSIQFESQTDEPEETVYSH